MTEPTPRKSDLGVRVVSAVVMVAVAGTALWLGGWVWAAFVAVVAVGVLWEWGHLVAGFAHSPVALGLWSIAGLAYVGLAALVMMFTIDVDGFPLVLLIVGAVVATDIGAYFTGRAVGGPKIAPRISPSKTWSGLVGGVAGSAMVVVAATILFPPWGRLHSGELVQVALLGAALAIVSQAGDFLESWMKRRAGVKDSGSLIPGHGGLFDRVDGLLAVSFVFGFLFLLFVAFVSERR